MRAAIRQWWWVVIPALVGVAATAISLAAGDGRTIVSETSLPWVWIALGVLISALLVVVQLVRSRARAVERRGHARGVAQQQEHQARFVARLDHELKNPITAIMAGVANLDSADAAAASIHSQAGRLARLLGDLRKLAELRSVALELSAVSLEQVAHDAATAVADLPEAAQRSISVSFPRAPRPLPTVRGDEDLLFLAVYNLLANAVKYSAAGDTIEVRGIETPDSAVIEVADTGRGIPADEIDSVWEELARGRGSLDVAGSGLGLPFVAAIVERHGGTVTIASRAGEGTLLRVSLPFARAL